MMEQLNLFSDIPAKPATSPVEGDFRDPAIHRFDRVRLLLEAGDRLAESMTVYTEADYAESLARAKAARDDFVYRNMAVAVDPEGLFLILPDQTGDTQQDA